MKRIKLSILFACLFLARLGTATAQYWSGPSPVTTTQPVGIGTSTPATGFSLHVDGDVRFTESLYYPNFIQFATPNAENGMSFIQGAGQRADLRFDGHTIKLVANNGGTPPANENGIAINTSGFVGLGNNNPLYRLNVNDNSKTDYGSWISANSKGPALWIRRDNVGTYTGAASYTSGIIPALQVENVSSDPDRIAGNFYANSIGVMATALAEKNTDIPTGIWGTGDVLPGSNICPNEVYGVRGSGQDGKYAYGVYGSGIGFIQAFGLVGVAQISCEGACVDDPSVTRSYGVYATTVPTSCTGYGYAGYFGGDVYASGTYISSDMKLKENIKPILNSLDIINKLAPKTYTFKQSDEFLGLNLPKGTRYGLIAQDIEKILPELVKRTVNPEIKDKNGKQISKEIDFKAVDYVSLIPILIGAIQQQQTQIDELKSQVAALNNTNPNPTGVSNINSTTKGASVLNQNVPNPASGETVISYQLINVTSAAYITVYDLNGTQVKQYSVDIHGDTNSISIKKGELQSGMYYYSLITDGIPVKTLKMVIL